MAQNNRPAIYFHLHLISDATGETLNAIAKATCAQFDTAKPIEHVYALIRSARQLERALTEIETTPGVVLYTMMNDELRETLEYRCRDFSMPCISVLDPVLRLLGDYLGAELSHKIGRQHQLNAKYFQRIEALNFTMAHDDGQNIDTVDEADVILLGVSRTSKTPTSVYLANRGIKVGNIPLVKDLTPPDKLFHLDGPLIIGLTATPQRLIQIRRNRLLMLEEETETGYIDSEEVRKEIIFAQRLYETNNWPVIDVSRRSIEETAAAVLNLISRRNAEPEKALTGQEE